MTKMSDFTKYETARILGARALQIAMNAPLLVKISKEDLEKVGDVKRKVLTEKEEKKLLQLVTIEEDKKNVK